MFFFDCTCIYVWSNLHCTVDCFIYVQAAKMMRDFDDEDEWGEEEVKLWESAKVSLLIVHSPFRELPDHTQQHIYRL